MFSSVDSFVFFETPLEFAQRSQTVALVFADPTLINLANRHWVEVVQLLAPAPDGRHEIGCFEKREMLGHRLPCHVQVLAKLSQSLTAVPMQLIEQFSPARIG